MPRQKPRAYLPRRMQLTSWQQLRPYYEELLGRRIDHVAGLEQVGEGAGDEGQDVPTLVLVLVLLTGSGLLLVAGETLVRPAATVVSGVAGGTSLFLLTRSGDTTCEVRLVLSAVAAVASAVFTLCVLRTTLFLLGAVGFGVVGYYVADALPLPTSSELFWDVGREEAAVIGGAAVLGAVVTACFRRQMLWTATSVVGAAGATWATHLLVRWASDGETRTLPAPASLGILLSLTCLGVCVQSRRHRHRQGRRGGKRADSPARRRVRNVHDLPGDVRL